MPDISALLALVRSQPAQPEPPTVQGPPLRPVPQKAAEGFLGMPPIPDLDGLYPPREGSCWLCGHPGVAWCGPTCARPSYRDAYLAAVSPS